MRGNVLRLCAALISIKSNRIGKRKREILFVVSRRKGKPTYIARNVKCENERSATCYHWPGTVYVEKERVIIRSKESFCAAAEMRKLALLLAGYFLFSKSAVFQWYPTSVCRVSDSRYSRASKDHLQIILQTTHNLLLYCNREQYALY